MQVRFLTPASSEFDDAVAYYESEQLGLGLRFARFVEQTLSRIELFPGGFQPVGKYSRRCLVPRFPYGVIYQHRASEQQIIVVAVAHLHRRPDYWLSREA